MTAFERNAHSALWWVVPVRWDASQCRLAVFQAFGAETNRGTAAASQATNGGMTTLLMNALILCVGGEVGAGVLFMGLWQSFGVAAKQTPHLLFGCGVYNWKDTYFKHMLAHPPLSFPRSQTPSPLACVSFCLPTETEFNLAKQKKKKKAQKNQRKADCSLSTFPSFAPAGQDE